MALTKLTFSGYSTESLAEAQGWFPDGGWMMAQLNPANYKLVYGNTYDDNTAQNGPQAFQVYNKPNPTVLTINDLIIDQTVVMFPLMLAGAFSNSFVYSVSSYVAALKQLLCDPYSDTHIPYFILVSWGSFSFVGVCTDFDVEYTLFDSLGFPLRAKMNVTFKSTVNPSKAMQLMGFNSPDLTHLRTANSGDNLPLMSSKIYGDSKYYVELAKINNLNSIFDLVPGNKVVFPPLKK